MSCRCNLRSIEYEQLSLKIGVMVGRTGLRLGREALAVWHLLFGEASIVVPMSTSVKWGMVKSQHEVVYVMALGVR